MVVAAAVVMVVLGVMWDVTRRTLSRPHPAAEVALPPETAAAGDTLPPPASSPPPGGAQSQGVRPPSGEGPGYLELVARAETRRQIRASAGLTYLNEIVAASGDSMLHRWDNRVSRPVRVHLASGRAANYQPAFLDAVREAFRAWEAVVPVRFDLSADSASAEVRLFWRVQFEIERTGQTDLEWDDNGHITGGVLTLATFDPQGQPMGRDEVRLVALHEVGHLVGLDHSPDSTDVMFPVATVRELSRRDIETARLLYRLAPGSLR